MYKINDVPEVGVDDEVEKYFASQKFNSSIVLILKIQKSL